MLRQDGLDTRAMRQSLEGESLGALFRRIETRARDADEVWAGNVRVLIRWRNYMAHRFFIDASDLIQPGTDCERA